MRSSRTVFNSSLNFSCSSFAWETKSEPFNVISLPGIGIDPNAVNPYVVSISSLNLTLSAAQTLEKGQTFTFAGSGSTVTITGNIKVNNVCNEALTLRFDVDKFLTQH